MSRDKLAAVHSFPIWLPQTQTWMYNQVVFLPKSIDAHVVCEQTQNLDQFHVQNLHTLKDESVLHYWLEGGLRRLRIRHFKRYLAMVSKKVGAAIIHSHFGHIGWDDAATARRLGLGHVVTFYGADVNRLPKQDARWRNRYDELFGSAGLFFCEGPHMAGELIRLGCKRDKIKIHHLGVDLRKFQYRPRRWDGHGPFRILIVAGFKEKKGIPYALRAVAQLQALVPVTVTIIGDAHSQLDGIMEKKRILQTLEKTSLHSKTRLLGFQSYSVVLREAYDHHVFLSPSVTASNGDTEGGAPVSLIEMMATGMPVVSTTHCDIPEVVQYGIDDWLAAERDVEGLVDRLRWLVKNRQYWSERLAAGRKHIEEEFDATLQGTKLEKHYRNVLTGSHEA